MYTASIYFTRFNNLKKLLILRTLIFFLIVCTQLTLIRGREAVNEDDDDDDDLRPSLACLVIGTLGCQAKCTALCLTYKCVSFDPYCDRIYCDCRETLPKKRKLEVLQDKPIPKNITFKKLVTIRFLYTEVVDDLDKVLQNDKVLKNSVMDFLRKTEKHGYDLKDTLKDKYPDLRSLLRRLKPRPLMQTKDFSKEIQEIRKNVGYGTRSVDNNNINTQLQNFDVNSPENKQRIIDLIQSLKNNKETLKAFDRLKTSGEDALYNSICEHFIRNGLVLSDGTIIVKPEQKLQVIKRKVKDDYILRQLQNSIKKSNKNKIKLMDDDNLNEKKPTKSKEKQNKLEPNIETKNELQKTKSPKQRKKEDTNTEIGKELPFDNSNKQLGTETDQRKPSKKKIKDDFNKNVIVIPETVDNPVPMNIAIEDNKKVSKKRPKQNLDEEQLKPENENKVNDKKKTLKNKSNNVDVIIPNTIATDTTESTLNKEIKGKNDVGNKLNNQLSLEPNVSKKLSKTKKLNDQLLLSENSVVPDLLEKPINDSSIKNKNRKKNTTKIDTDNITKPQDENKVQNKEKSSSKKKDINKLNKSIVPVDQLPVIQATLNDMVSKPDMQKDTNDTADKLNKNINVDLPNTTESAISSTTTSKKQIIPDKSKPRKEVKKTDKQIIQGLPNLDATNTNLLSSSTIHNKELPRIDNPDAIKDDLNKIIPIIENDLNIIDQVIGNVRQNINAIKTIDSKDTNAKPTLNSQSTLLSNTQDISNNNKIILSEPVLSNNDSDVLSKIATSVENLNMLPLSSEEIDDVSNDSSAMKSYDIKFIQDLQKTLKDLKPFETFKTECEPLQNTGNFPTDNVNQKNCLNNKENKDQNILIPDNKNLPNIPNNLVQNFNIGNSMYTVPTLDELQTDNSMENISNEQLLQTPTKNFIEPSELTAYPLFETLSEKHVQSTIPDNIYSVFTENTDNEQILHIPTKNDSNLPELTTYPLFETVNKKFIQPNVPKISNLPIKSRDKPKNKKTELINSQLPNNSSQNTTEKLQTPIESYTTLPKLKTHPLFETNYHPIINLNQEPTHQELSNESKDKSQDNNVKLINPIISNNSAQKLFDQLDIPIKDNIKLPKLITAHSPIKTNNFANLNQEPVQLDLLYQLSNESKDNSEDISIESNINPIILTNDSSQNNSIEKPNLIALNKNNNLNNLVSTTNRPNFNNELSKNILASLIPNKVNKNNENYNDQLNLKNIKNNFKSLPQTLDTKINLSEEATNDNYSFSLDSSENNHVLVPLNSLENTVSQNINTDTSKDLFKNENNLSNLFEEDGNEVPGKPVENNYKTLNSNHNENILEKPSDNLYSKIKNMKQDLSDKNIQNTNKLIQPKQESIPLQLSTLKNPTVIKNNISKQQPNDIISNIKDKISNNIKNEAISPSKINLSNKLYTDFISNNFPTNKIDLNVIENPELANIITENLGNKNTKEQISNESDLSLVDENNILIDNPPLITNPPETNQLTQQSLLHRQFSELNLKRNIPTVSSEKVLSNLKTSSMNNNLNELINSSTDADQFPNILTDNKVNDFLQELDNMENNNFSDKFHLLDELQNNNKLPIPYHSQENLNNMNLNSHEFDQSSNNHEPLKTESAKLDIPISNNSFKNINTLQHPGAIRNVSPNLKSNKKIINTEAVMNYNTSTDHSDKNLEDTSLSIHNNNKLNKMKDISTLSTALNDLDNVIGANGSEEENNHVTTITNSNKHLLDTSNAQAEIDEDSFDFSDDFYQFESLNRASNKVPVKSFSFDDFYKNYQNFSK